MQKLIKVLIGGGKVLGFYREGKDELREIEDDREVMGIIRNVTGQRQGDEHGVLIYMSQEEYKRRLRQDEEGDYDLR